MKTILFFITSLVLTACNTTSTIYLQNAMKSDDKSYGYTQENPVCLKYSKRFGFKSIIEEYISRLYTADFQNFNIAENKTVKIEKSKSVKRNQDSEKIEQYKITSEKGNEKYTLYFELVKHKKKFYYPYNLAFSFLAGQ